ncbi:MAG: recombinase family protein [Verrucomicrobiae bacterium]|nr:recombinase family protein [Verrucomicrobiae bacterium]
MKGQNIGYVRVSTIGQNSDRQLGAENLDKIFTDQASGSSKERPGLEDCLSYLRDGDVLHVHSIDRLARNLCELQRIVRDLNGKGVSIRFHQEGLSFEQHGQANAMNTLLFQVMGAFAEFERALIHERQAEGIAKAKSQGKHLGRPNSLTMKQKIEINFKKNQGESVASLAKTYRVSRQSIYNVIKHQDSPQK